MTPDQVLPQWPSWSVGIDLVQINDITESIATFGDRFVQRVFTAGEIRDAAGDHRRLAARFAAKEALVKAIGNPSMATPLHEMEVVLQNGVPAIVVHGSIADSIAPRNSSHLQLSLSHADCHACAIVAITG